MRSPVRGTHRTFPPRFFVTVPITSLKFWANIPTCFPNIFSVLSPLWILRMQRHAGKQGTCRCIPRSCIFRMLVIVNYELHHTKNRSKLDIARWWSRPIQISKPIWTGILPYKHQSSTKLVLTNSALCWFKQVQKMWVLFCSSCCTFYVHISDSCPPTFTEFCSVMEDSSAKQLPVVPTKNGLFKGKCPRPKFTRNIKTLAQMKTSAHPFGPFLTQPTPVLHYGLECPGWSGSLSKMKSSASLFVLSLCQVWFLPLCSHHVFLQEHSIAHKHNKQ